MTERKENPTPKATYHYLLEDADVSAGTINVARGSAVTAAGWLTWMGFVQEMRKDPRGSG